MGPRRRRRPLEDDGIAAQLYSPPFGGSLYSSTDDAADERRRPRASTTSSAPSLYMADARQLPGRRDAIPFHPLQQRLGVNNDVLQSLPPVSNEIYT